MQRKTFNTAFNICMDSNVDTDLLHQLLANSINEMSLE